MKTRSLLRYLFGFLIAVFFVTTGSAFACTVDGDCGCSASGSCICQAPACVSWDCGGPCTDGAAPELPKGVFPLLLIGGATAVVYLRHRAKQRRAAV